jgi:hypothetical protein
MGNGTLSLGVKQPGHGVDHPPPSSSEIEWVELYLFLPALAHYIAFTLVYLYLYYLCLSTLTSCMSLCQMFSLHIVIGRS